MKQNTTLSTILEVANEKIQYDNTAKKLLSEKVLLAWIMKHCMKEYQNETVDDIAMKYINGIPRISIIPIDQDVEVGGTRIEVGGVEDASINEGVITYDIRYRAYVPTVDGMIGLIINLEAQNDYYPGYPLVTRGVYYSSRMISSQAGTVFENSHYEKIEKVYSIWICTNPPKKHENSITSYRVFEDNIVGHVKENTTNYDLINVIMICLGSSEQTEHELLKLLDVLLKDTSEVCVKKQILSEEFGIPMTRKMESEVNVMCNLSDGIERNAIERGLEAGRAAGHAEKIVEVIRRNKDKLTSIQLADFIGEEYLYVEEILRILARYPQENNQKIVRRFLYRLEKSTM